MIVTSRPLEPEEAALWIRVLATVRPLPGRKVPIAAPVSEAQKPVVRQATTARGGRPKTSSGKTEPTRVGTTLDASWDRQLSRGLTAPDSVVDLHGHSLSGAYARLDAALEQAVAQGDRVLLLITGNPPRDDSERPHRRGAIRDAVGGWLAASRHAGAIAAVRNAHPRHGGKGALYIILRRRR